MPKKLTRALYKTDLGATNLAEKIRENDPKVRAAGSRLVSISPHQWAVFINFKDGTGAWAATAGKGYCPLYEYPA